MNKKQVETIPASVASEARVVAVLWASTLSPSWSVETSETYEGL